MVYDIQKRGRGSGVYCAIVLQKNCNSEGTAGGRGQHTSDGFVHKSLEVNECLVKAKAVG